MLVDDPVKRVDTMTMAWGLGARVPFFDHDFVELAAMCPTDLELASGGKGVLKEASRSLLPADVIDRTKGYFPVPGIRHLNGRYSRWCAIADQRRRTEPRACTVPKRSRRCWRHQTTRAPCWARTRYGNSPF